MKKLHVWCQEPLKWEAERILQESEGEGVEASLYEYQYLSCEIGEGGVSYLYRGDEYVTPNAVIFRPALTRDKPAMRALIREFRRKVMNSAIVLNSEVFRLNSFDKLFQQVCLVEGGFPYVKTSVFCSEDGLQQLDIGESLVMKPVIGSLGEGVREIDSMESVLAINNAPGNYIFQEVLEPGRDFRVLVLGGEVLGVMQRDAKKGNFVSNYSQGGSIKAVQLKNDVLKMAVDVVKYFSLDYVGVDLMKDKEGKWRVLELNSMAQFKGFEKSTGVNVARKTIEYLVRREKARR